MRLLRQRLSPLEVFLLVIFVTFALSSSLTVYRDIQVYERLRDDLPRDDSFTISGPHPVSRAMIPVRLVLMTSLLVSFIGVRSRKLVGLVLSTLGLLSLMGLYLQWWRHSLELAKTFQDIGAKEMSHTLYLKDGNWLDIGVCLASVWALGWVVATLIVDSKAGRGKVLPP